MTAHELELEALEVCLRARVAEGRYGPAHDVLRQYCGTLRKAAAGLARGDPRLGRLEKDWRRLASDMRRQLLAGRAHAGVRLARLAQASQGPRRYGAGGSPRRTWEWLA
jgi:hypothetical protein